MGNRDPFFQFLKDEVGGRLSEATDALRRRESFSIIEFTTACRSGREELHNSASLRPKQIVWHNFPMTLS